MPTKVAHSLSLFTTTVELLREKAEIAGLSVSSVAELCIAYGLERLSPEALAAKAEEKRASHMKPIERRVLDVMPRALEYARRIENDDTQGMIYVPAQDIANVSGEPYREVYRALQALAARGLVVPLEDLGGKLDRWGRPLNSAWALTADVARKAEEGRRRREAARAASEG